MDTIVSRSTDLSDSEWAEIEPLLPAPRPAGLGRMTNRRLALNIWMFKAWSGTAYHRLPKDFGINWRVAYDLYPHLCDDALAKLDEFASRRGRLTDVAANACLAELRSVMRGAVPRLDDVERVLIGFAIGHFGHQRRAAKALGIGVRTLYEKLRKHFPELLRTGASPAKRPRQQRAKKRQLDTVATGPHLEAATSQPRSWATAEAERLVREMSR